MWASANDGWEHRWGAWTSSKTSKSTAPRRWKTREALEVDRSAPLEVRGALEVDRSRGQDDCGTVEVRGSVLLEVRGMLEVDRAASLEVRGALEDDWSAALEARGALEAKKWSAFARERRRQVLRRDRLRW